MQTYIFSVFHVADFEVTDMKLWQDCGVLEAMHTSVFPLCLYSWKFRTEGWLWWKTIEHCQICFGPCSLDSFYYPFRKCTTGNAGTGLVIQFQYNFLNQHSEFTACEQATAWMHWCNVWITSKGIQHVENNSLLMDSYGHQFTLSLPSGWLHCLLFLTQTCGLPLPQHTKYA